MANRKSPSEIARRENWKAMFAGAKRRGMERPFSPEAVPKKAETPPQKDTEAPTRVMHVGVTRSATEKPRRSRSIAVPECTDKNSSAPQSMDTVRRVLRKMENPSTDENGNRHTVDERVESVGTAEVESAVPHGWGQPASPSRPASRETVGPMIAKVVKVSPQSFEPLMSWPLPNGNGACAVAHNGTVAVRYGHGEFARIGSVGRTVEKNEKKRSVLKEVEPIYNAHLNRLRKSERKTVNDP